MTYLLQILTDDFGLQLRTERTADSIEGLLILAKQMVAMNPNVKGMTYRIFAYTNKVVNQKQTATCLKEAVILG